MLNGAKGEAANPVYSVQTKQQKEEEHQIN
jgi:hypothetical protein